MTDPRSLGAIWHDPASYNHFDHGPPYLPEQKMATKVASRFLGPTGRISSRVATRYLLAEEADPTTRMRTLLNHFLGEYGNKPFSELGAVLSFLRCLAVLHQSHHWMTRGPEFYADHLMYDRLYEAVIEDIDSVAERTVGTPGADRSIVHPVTQTHQLATLIASIEAEEPIDPTPEGYVNLSLRAELHFLLFVNIVVENLKTKGQLSRGTDNLIADIQDRHEGHIYLLKQRLGGMTPE